MYLDRNPAPTAYQTAISISEIGTKQVLSSKKNNPQYSIRPRIDQNNSMLQISDFKEEITSLRLNRHSPGPQKYKVPQHTVEKFILKSPSRSGYSIPKQNYNRGKKSKSFLKNEKTNSSFYFGSPFSSPDNSKKSQKRAPLQNQFDQR